MQQQQQQKNCNNDSDNRARPQFASTRDVSRRWKKKPASLSFPKVMLVVEMSKSSPLDPSSSYFSGLRRAKVVTPSKSVRPSAVQGITYAEILSSSSSPSSSRWNLSSWKYENQAYSFSGWLQSHVQAHMPKRQRKMYSFVHTALAPKSQKLRLFPRCTTTRFRL